MDFVAESGSSYQPRRTHAFLKFDDFPPDYSQFHRLIVKMLELPRESVVSIMMFEDFFSSIHALDQSRYVALKAILDCRGRPNDVQRRKIYAICNWHDIARYLIHLNFDLKVTFRQGQRRRKEVRTTSIVKSAKREN